MPERKKERKRTQVDNPTEPRTVDKKAGKQTKFVLDVGDIQVTPEQVEDMRSEILRSAIDHMRKNKFVDADGRFARPKIGVEFFSVSFSLSFSLGA